MTGWLPARDLRINESNAMIGDRMRIAATDRYDLREVVFTTGGLTDWLSGTPAAREALSNAVQGKGSVEAFDKLIGPSTADNQGPTHYQMRATSLRSLSVSDSTVVVGDDARVKVNNRYSMRRIEVDILDCLKYGWMSPHGFVEALRGCLPDSTAQEDGVARLIRDGGRAVAQADIATLALHTSGPIDASSTRVGGWGSTKSVDDANVAAVGVDNNLVTRIDIRRPGSVINEVARGLPEVLWSIGIDPGRSLEPAINPDDDLLEPPPRARAVVADDPLQCYLVGGSDATPSPSFEASMTQSQLPSRGIKGPGGGLS